MQSIIVSVQQGIIVGNFIERHEQLLIMGMLASGAPQRRVATTIGVNRETVSRYGLIFGGGAQRVHDRLFRNLAFGHVQVDEIHGWVAKKNWNRRPDDPKVVGENWTFVALDKASRLVVNWLVDKRNAYTTDQFIADLRRRLIVRPRITSDGMELYPAAIAAHFGEAIDYAQLVKNYKDKPKKGEKPPPDPDDEPFITKRIIYGAPDLDDASTSYVERNNGTARLFNARMHRRTVAFSKELEHHRASVALVYAYYNLCHVVRTLKTNPATVAGITSKPWTHEEFYEEIMSAPEVEPPTVQPLVVPTPGTTHRKLPGDRGFLRVVPAHGGGPSAPAAPSSEPAVTVRQRDEDPNEPE